MSTQFFIAEPQSLPAHQMHALAHMAPPYESHFVKTGASVHTIQQQAEQERCSHTAASDHKGCGNNPGGNEHKVA